MRGLRLALAVALVAGVNGCGGGDARDNADATKTVTSEFLTAQPKRGYTEASTPGSGGFIETPQSERGRNRQAELGEDVPAVRRAPGSGESVFTGVLRDAYVTARSACRKVSPRELAQNLGVRSTNPVVIAGMYAGRHHRLTRWQAAFEGCAVALLSKPR